MHVNLPIEFSFTRGLREERSSFLFCQILVRGRSNMIGLEDHCIDHTVFLDLAKMNVRV